MNLKDLLNHVSATSLMLVFLFFCGTLYIISYWSTFNFDITNYIELFDIPKSFVFPLATGLGVSLLSLLAQGLINVEKADETPSNAPMVNKKPKGLFRLMHTKILNFVTLATLGICMLFFDAKAEWVIISAGLVLTLWGFSKTNKSSRMVAMIPDRKLRLFFSVLVVFIPVYSFCKGKLDSIAVSKNRNYYTVTSIIYLEQEPETSEIVGKKLLGKLGSVIVITDSSNSNITVVSLTGVQFVQYKFHKSPSLLSQ